MKTACRCAALWCGFLFVSPGCLQQRGSPSQVRSLVGADDTLPASFLRTGFERARAVGLSPGRGTLFLICNDLVMTNHHVFPNPHVAEGAFALFGLEADGDGMPPVNPRKFPLRPRDFYYSNASLDFAVVSVEGQPGREFGFVDLRRHAVIEHARFANIVHHPGGGLKRISIRENRLTVESDVLLRYTGDTETGSSGAPVFDDVWNLIGVHFLGEREPGHGNSAHRIEPILADLFRAHPGLLAEKCSR